MKIDSARTNIILTILMSVAYLLLGACAESGETRKKTFSNTETRNTSNDEDASKQTDDGNGNNQGDENTSELAGLSLQEQCAKKGEGFVYSESEESCFKIIEKKTSEEVCQSVEQEYLPDNGSCAAVSAKQKLADICSAKGANYQYNSAEATCYEVSASSTSEELCTAAGQTVEFDAELQLCRVFATVQTVSELCLEVSGTVIDQTCDVAGVVKDLVQLCADKGVGFFLYPSVDAPVSCNSVSELIPAAGLCLSQGEQNHIYKQDTGTCENVNNQQEAVSECQALGDNWNFVQANEECAEYASEQLLVDLCKGPTIRCIYLDEESLWGIISEESTAKELCESRGSDFTLNDKGQCQHKDGEIFLPDGTRVKPDGTKILPDGTEVKPDGTKVLPDGTEIKPDGTKVLPDGTEIKPDGTKVLPDGTEIKPDGTVVDKDGNPLPKEPDGSTILPDGTVISPDGTVTQPDGTVISPDGTVTKPDGTVISPDGTTKLPDGTEVKPDGTTILPDGTQVAPDGTTTLPDGSQQTPGGDNGDGSTAGDTILPNGQPQRYTVALGSTTYDGKGQRYALANGTYASWLDRYDDHYGDNSSHPQDYWAGPQIVRTIELKCPAGYRVKGIEAEKTYVVVDTKVGEYINWLAITCINFDSINPREVTRREGRNLTERTNSAFCPGSEVVTGLGAAVYEVFPKNFELECAPFSQFEVESGDKTVNFTGTERLFTGRGLFTNDAIGERRYYNSCNDNFTRNRILTGLKFAVDMSNRAGDYWVPLWVDPLCSELIVSPK